MLLGARPRGPPSPRAPYRSHFSPCQAFLLCLITATVAVGLTARALPYAAHAPGAAASPALPAAAAAAQPQPQRLQQQPQPQQQAPQQPQKRRQPTGPMANEAQTILRRPVALLFGDSLTERALDPEGGWGAALAHHFARKADVINRGFGGYNSRWALPLLDQVLAQVAAPGQPPVLFATIWLGANDAARPGTSAARQHVPLADYSANLEAMVKKMRAAGVERVVLITPPPVHDEGRIKLQQQRMGTSRPVDPDRTNAFTAKYADAVRSLGARLGAPVLDLHSALQKHRGWETELLSDGLHFSAEGQAAVGRMLIKLLKQEFPELSLEAMSNHFPWWDKLADAGPDGEEALWSSFLEGSK